MWSASAVHINNKKQPKYIRLGYFSLIFNSVHLVQPVVHLAVNTLWDDDW